MDRTSEGGTHGLYNSCQVQGTLENICHDTLREGKGEPFLIFIGSSSKATLTYRLHVNDVVLARQIEAIK